MKLRQRQVEQGYMPGSVHEARELGAPKFFTGALCRKGHLAPRYTSNNKCVECMAGYNKQAVVSGAAAERRRQQYKENPDRFKKAQQAYYRRSRVLKKPVDWEPGRAATYRRARLKFRLNHPEKYKQRMQESYQKHRHSHIERAAFHKARKIKATPSWADRRKIKEIYKRCLKMRGDTGIDYEVDHIVPLNGVNVCGLHVENNLQILTSEANLQKSNKWEDNYEA